MAATETRPLKQDPRGPVQTVTAAWSKGDPNVKTLTRTEVLTVLLHRWESGGEIKAHYHTDSDAVWVVLEGQATFHGENNQLLGQANPHEAVVIPRFTTYWFENTSDVPVVMFRVSARVQNDAGAPRTDDRVYLEPAK